LGLSVAPKNKISHCRKKSIFLTWKITPKTNKVFFVFENKTLDFYFLQLYNLNRRLKIDIAIKAKYG